MHKATIATVHKTTTVTTIGTTSEEDEREGVDMVSLPNYQRNRKNVTVEQRLFSNMEVNFLLR